MPQNLANHCSEGLHSFFFNSFDGICGELTSCLCCVCDTKAYIQFSYFFWIYYGVTSCDWAVWIFLTGKYTCVCYLGTILGFASSCWTCRMCRTEFRSKTLEMWTGRWLSPYLIKRIAIELSLFSSLQSAFSLSQSTIFLFWKSNHCSRSNERNFKYHIEFISLIWNVTLNFGLFIQVEYLFS